MATILIVDDDSALRLIVGEMLRENGHTVVEAEDGEEAIKIATRTKIDLVVLDMLMPNKDGLETTLELRRQSPDMQILAISSGGRLDPGSLLRTAMAFGANRCMAKPLRPGPFRETIARMLAA